MANLGQRPYYSCPDRWVKGNHYQGVYGMFLWAFEFRSISSKYQMDVKYGEIKTETQMDY